MTDVSDCADVLLMARGSTYTGAGLTLDAYTSPDGTTRVPVTLATPRTENNVDAVPTASMTLPGHYRYLQPRVNNNVGGGGPSIDVTAWIWCATSPSYAVGGFAEYPAVAGTSGSGMGGATYAVLAGTAAGVLAFAVLATLTVRRWRPGSTHLKGKTNAPFHR